MRNLSITVVRVENAAMIFGALIVRDDVAQITVRVPDQTITVKTTMSDDDWEDVVLSIVDGDSEEDAGDETRRERL